MAEPLRIATAGLFTTRHQTDNVEAWVRQSGESLCQSMM